MKPYKKGELAKDLAVRLECFGRGDTNFHHGAERWWVRAEYHHTGRRSVRRMGWE